MSEQCWRNGRSQNKDFTHIKPVDSTPIIMTSVAPVAPLRPILPSHGVAKVKSVLSGDTVVLLGKAGTPGGRAPEVVFTFEKVSAPRYVFVFTYFNFEFLYLKSVTHLQSIQINRVELHPKAMATLTKVEHFLLVNG